MPRSLELRQAIERDELLLHYQPELDLRDGSLVGVEALVRWPHPEHGFLPPGEFLPLAEQSGLIHLLSLWVLNTALRQQQAWRAAGLAIPVAVNLSRHMLHDQHLHETIADLVTRWGVPPSALVIEMSEGSLIANPLRSGDNLKRLRALGVRVSIDDFGAGYSSLASLKNLLVDELKIDQSFVHDLATDASARSMVRAIIGLAEALKLRVVAEGVEDRATWEVLAGLGCHVAQGYFLSPPLAAHELEEQIARLGSSWVDIANRPGPDDALQERTRARLTADEAEFVARHNSESALRTSEERNRLALEAARIGTWDADPIHNVITWSTETEAQHGLAPGTFGKTFEALQRVIDPQDWPGFASEMHLADVEHRETLVIYRTIWPDGSVHWIEASGRGVHSEAGTMIRVTGTSTEITERKQAEQQRETAAKSEKLRALGQMASGIAHDLNQTLMLVVSYSTLARQALAQTSPDIDEVVDLLTTTTQAALDGGETVKRLLLFTRTAPEHDGRLVDLVNSVRDAAQLTAPRWRDAAQREGRPISLHVEAPEDVHPFVQGSSSQLRDLMINLIFNAVDALPDGGTICLRVAVQDDLGIIEVSDSGVGMNAEVQARVFEPFFTTKGAAGTGLGLAMVFGIVEQHGGHIDVRSAPGEGTTFRIALPLAIEPAEAAPPIHAPLRVEHSGPLRVLVVDDEPMMTKAVVRMLKPLGHAVSAAGSGEEALDELATHTFDVVVSDMGMGAGMNGWDLAVAVKLRWPGLRFLLATGWGAAIDPAEARARGVEAVLAKPYNPDDLVRALAGTDAAA